MVVKLGQNLPEMIMCVADVAREKQHGRCSNNAKQSNHSIKTFSQVLFFFVFVFVFKEQREALISYLSFPTVCGRGPINIAPNQLLPSPLMYMHGTQHNQCPGLVGLDALSQSPISMHAKYKPQDFTDVIIIWKLHCIAWKIGPNKVIDWCGSIFCYDKLGW